MLSKQRLVGWIFVAVLLVAVAAWVFLGTAGLSATSPAAEKVAGKLSNAAPNTSRPTNSGTGLSIAVEPGKTSQVTRPGIARATAALPPLNTRVKDVIAQLKKDADDGVPQAACRVGEELTRCWQARQQLAARDRMLSKLGAIPPDSDQARAISAQADTVLSGVKRDKDLCEGIADSDTDDAWRYLLKAAMAGNSAAMAQFAINPPLSTDNVVGSLDGWAAYRQYAPDFMRRSIEEGRALQGRFFTQGEKTNVSSQLGAVAPAACAQ